MAAEPMRAALLARSGPARDRLVAVLAAAGAECVLEADPAELEPAALAAAGAEVVLVALEPAIEDVLERFDEVLFDPAVDVIYEEAALAAGREGWEIARWQRHLVAKLQRHGDVLPPGHEPDEDDDASTGDPPDAPLDAAPVTTLEASFAPVPGGHDPFDPVAAESGAPGQAEADPELLAMFESVSLPVGDASTPRDDGRQAEGFDALLDGLTDAPEPTAADIDAGINIDIDTGADPTPEAQGLDDSRAAPDPYAVQPSSGFGELTLQEDGSVSATPSPEADHRFRRDLSELEERISTLTLVDDTPVTGPEQAVGAVVVMAGIGGPDAVRQLLGALPPEFPRPVLVQQRLDGARHDRLVAQMQRATTLPVELARAGSAPEAGVIHILPADIGLEVVAEGGLRFAEGAGLLESLPSADSAVLLLSGSDPALVDAVMKHGWAGALVAGQAEDGCYDAAAPTALAARGGETAPPAELALRLAQRWT